MSTTPLGRLRETFLADTDIRSALLCTYGLDPLFFEAEILPAMLPTQLATDASAGSLAAYVFDADQATAQTPVEVFYDHITGEGPQLKVGYQKVTLGNRAFHAKLVIAQYDDRLRVIVSSANLTRPAWTSLFELFVVEDLYPDTPHPWTAGLKTFVRALVGEADREGPAARRILERLADVGAATPQTLHHSYDGALLDRVFPAGEAKQVTIVSPFFEGEDGAGLFDELQARYPSARVQLFLASSKTDAGYVVTGPPDKLRELRAGGADLQLIHSLWDDIDDDRAPEHRGLHGKLLSVKQAGQHHVSVGSANATRAALLGSVSHGGNVELIVTQSLSPAALRQLLPPSFDAPADVEFSPADISGEDDPQNADAAAFVLIATYSARTLEVTLHLTDNAPPLDVAYAGKPLGSTEVGRWSAPLALRLDMFLTVDAGLGPAVVPIVVLDPERLAPRGAPADLDLESLADLLAGHRQLVHAPGGSFDLAVSGSGSSGVDFFGRGAIPWRRILAGLHGLQDDLTAQLGAPEVVAWTLSNPLRLGGLLERFEAAHEHGRFLEGDLAFAWYETIRMLDQVTAPVEPPAVEARALVNAEAERLRQRLDVLLGGGNASIQSQISILRETETA